MATDITILNILNNKKADKSFTGASVWVFESSFIGEVCTL